MSVILRGAVKLYYYLNDEIRDTRTQDWFLIRSPWPGLALLTLYLLMVLRWLPDYMKNRPAYDLRSIMAVYNASQMIGCIYIAYKGLTLGWLNHYSLLCQGLDNGPNALEYAWTVCYGYFVMKLIDLLDTIFFVLRKKHNQVTFLHVYHHWGMVAVSWGIVKWVPGGHVTSLIILNSIVHFVMYGYYLMTSLDGTNRQALRRWKKHITQIQIFQFAMLFVHHFAMLLKRECAFPSPPAYILLPQNFFMLLLFSDFYYRSYFKSKKQ
ncbi:unnamed protein product [Arctia plantaginis]|uniref:Elongation of very long chain fatty acids protein n=1 Tax=Arctia plantaginis TaxID=874455 RepID=A0A8S1ALU6_ARCPL|nr:unnamed protein product [Arctia plantaginis]